MQKTELNNSIVDLDSYLENKRKNSEYLQSVDIDVVKKEYNSFFSKYDFIKAMGFTAYTPYFMDGDPCEYSVDGYYLLLTQEVTNELGYGVALELIADTLEPDEDLSDKGALETYFEQHFWDFPSNYSFFNYYPGEPKIVKPGYSEFIKDLYALEAKTLDSDLCSAIYGDHVKVIVKPSDITVMEYDHG